jgi:hypothetical protein
VRAIQEITFIVAGVLIALAANSWWEHRDERDRERLNLRLLHDATEENLRPNWCGNGRQRVLVTGATMRTPVVFPRVVTNGWIDRGGSSRGGRFLPGRPGRRVDA